MLKFTKVFTVRIVYKSGYTHDFECTEFTMKNGNCEWNAYGVNNKPILLGISEIAAVYQMGYRNVIKWN